MEEWLNEIEKPECGRHTMMTAGAGSMDEAATADATTIVRNFLGEKAFFENGYDGDGGNRECQLDKSDVDKVGGWVQSFEKCFEMTCVFVTKHNNDQKNTPQR